MDFNYKFLDIIGQLAANRIAHFSFRGRELLLEWNEGKCFLSTPVFKGENMEEWVSSAQMLKWDEGFQLHIDEMCDTVFLKAEIIPLLQLQTMEQSVLDFLDLAVEWEEIFSKLQVSI